MSVKLIFSLLTYCVLQKTIKIVNLKLQKLISVANPPQSEMRQPIFGHIFEPRDSTPNHSSPLYLSIPDAALIKPEIVQSSLQPANEVWGKVMFLHVSVILSKRGGVVYSSMQWDRQGEW